MPSYVALADLSTTDMVTAAYLKQLKDNIASFYETVGTWTPVLGGTGGTSGQTYSGQVGEYVKVGRLVYASFRVTLSAKGTITGNCQIQGLPFACDTSVLNAIGSVTWENLASNWVTMMTAVIASTTTAKLLGAQSANANNITPLTTTDINNNTIMNGTIVYRVSA